MTNKRVLVTPLSAMLACLASMTAIACSSSNSNEPSGVGGHAGAAGAKVNNAGAAGRTSDTQGGAAGTPGSTAGVPSTSAGASVVAGAAGSVTMAGAAGTAGTAGTTTTAALAGFAGFAGNKGSTAPFVRLTGSALRPILRVLPKQAIDVTVTIAREGSDAGDVTLSVKDQPFGVGNASATIPGGSNSGQLQIPTQESLTIGGPYSFSIVASSAADPSISVEIPVTLYVAQAPGSFDKSFGSNGISTLKVIPQGNETFVPSDHVTDATVDKLSRIVIGGYTNANDQRAWVARLNPDGTFDSKFANGGKLTEFGQSPSYIDRLTLSSGQLYLGVRASTFTYVRKLTEAGTGDSTFNGNLDLAVGSQVTAMAPLRAGVLIAPGAPLLIAPDGKTDSTFTAPLGVISIGNMGVDAKGMVTYWDTSLTSQTDFKIGRMFSSGVPDGAFGTSGNLSITCPTEPLKSVPSSVRTILTTSGQMILVLTNCGAGGRDTFNREGAIVGLAPDGSPVLAWGPSGRRAVAQGTNSFVVGGVLQSDDQLVVAYGTVTLDSTSSPVTSYKLNRYTTKAREDTTFGSAGVIDLGIPSSAVVYDASAHRVVVVGDATDGGISIARIWL